MDINQRPLVAKDRMNRVDPADGRIEQSPFVAKRSPWAFDFCIDKVVCISHGVGEIADTLIVVHQRGIEEAPIVIVGPRWVTVIIKSYDFPN